MLCLRKGIFSFLIFIFAFNAYANTCAGLFSGLSAQPQLRTESLVRWEKTKLPMELIKQDRSRQKSLDYIYLKTKKRTNIKESDLFSDTSDIIIGIDTTGYTRGHVYMIVNNKRVDGHILYAAQTERTENWSLSNGLFFRIKNLPEKNKRELMEWASSADSVRGMTCVTVACHVLFGKAKLIKGPKDELWFPSEIINFIVNRGLYGHKEQKVDVEVYSLNKKADVVLKDLPRWGTLPGLFFMLFDPKTWGF